MIDSMPSTKTDGYSTLQFGEDMEVFNMGSFLKGDGSLEYHQMGISKREKETGIESEYKALCHMEEAMKLLVFHHSLND